MASALNYCTILLNVRFLYLKVFLPSKSVEPSDSYQVDVFMPKFKLLININYQNE